MVKSLRGITLLIFLLVLSGCATLYNPATGRNEMIFLNSQTEVSIGESVIPEFLSKHPLSNDPVLNNGCVELAVGWLMPLTVRIFFTNFMCCEI